MEFKPGADWVGGVKARSPGHGAGCEGVQPRPRVLLLECDSRGARGYCRVDTKVGSQPSTQFLAILGPKITCGESPDSLDIRHPWKSQPLVRNQKQTESVRDERLADIF